VRRPHETAESAAPAGRLRVHREGDFQLESGEILRDLRQEFRMEGELGSARGNLVLPFHSLTGSPADFADWEPIVGPGLTIDPRRFTMVAANLLGS
jgi:homoserine O-acetyltransferase